MKLSWYKQLYVFAVFFLGIYFFLKMGLIVGIENIDSLYIILCFVTLVASYIGEIPIRYSFNFSSLWNTPIYFTYGIFPLLVIVLIESLFASILSKKSTIKTFFNIGQLLLSNLGAHYLFSTIKFLIPDNLIIDYLIFFSFFILLNTTFLTSIFYLADIFSKKIILEIVTLYLLSQPLYNITWLSFKHSPYITIILVPALLHIIKKQIVKNLDSLIDNEKIDDSFYIFKRQFIFDFISRKENKIPYFVTLIQFPCTNKEELSIILRNIFGPQIFCRFTSDRILIISDESISDRLSLTAIPYITRQINASVYPEQLLHELEDELNHLSRRSIRQREIALSKSVQLATIGQLAAGLAHEIRNPLTAVKGFLQLYRFGIRLDSDKIKLMQTELNRINQLVTDLLYLSAPTTDLNSAKKHDLNHIIHEVAELLQPELANKSIVMHLELSPLPSLPIDRNQIKQVILNLLQNAIQAIDYKGQIVIKTEADNSQVLTTIIDNGPGIPASLQEKIFDPFFTTKNHGTGLGLTICRQLIIAHGGQINLQSRPGRTEVIITLPV